MPLLVKKEEPKNEKLLQARQSFIEGAGRISASLLGILNRVCGQIYALLYLSPEPLSLDDIVGELGVSKGNVSINIRILEDYKLVKKVWVKGTRKDYYQAVDTLPAAIIREFFTKIRRNIQDSLDMIDDCAQLAEEGRKGKGGNPADAQFMMDRLERVRSFYKNADLLFEAVYSGRKIDTSVLKTVIDGS